MNKILKLILISSSFLFFYIGKALAICPVCTVAIGVGVGFSRWLGIDDTITGLWIGGFTVSLIMWTLNWMDKKNVHFKLRKIGTVLVYYLIIIIPLFWTGIMGHVLNKIWGIDKLLIGIIFGSLIFWGSALWYQKIKNGNNGKPFFPFQKVVMPVGFLAAGSLIFYLLTR